MDQYLELDPEPIFGYDYKGDIIYEGEEYFEVDGELVLKEDAEVFLEDKYGLQEATI